MGGFRAAARWCGFAMVALASHACGALDPATDLGTLVARDSTYYDPASGEPFTGRVYRDFPDGSPDGHELEGRLVDGTWDGELVIYHPSGRVRYTGSFDHGQKCGPWSENVDDREPADVFDELRSEIESMGMYPPCPTDR